MTKVDILCKTERFGALKRAMFNYNVENVVRVRTGEQGCDALQDDETR